MSGWGHLAARFAGAHRPGGAPRTDRRWVAEVLTPPELELWRRQPGYDQRHTVAVARRVDAALAGGPFAGDGRWLAAALLHDIGKLDPGLGIYGRVVATLAAKAWPGRLAGWEHRRGLRRRIARYRRHDELGAGLIRAAGGREAAATWAEAHHGRGSLDPAVVPPPVAAALDAADDD